MKQAAIKWLLNLSIASAAILFQINQFEHLVVLVDPLLLLVSVRSTLCLINKGWIGLRIVATLRVLRHVSLKSIGS